MLYFFFRKVSVGESWVSLNLVQMKAINITRVDSYSLCVGKIKISISVVAAADDKGALGGQPVT